MKVETLSQTRRAASAPLRRKLIAVLVAACYTTAEASPVSPTVVAGQASFNLQGKTYSITNTPNTIINWQSFSVASDEITRFIQQSADSKVLNRITGQDPTQILGSLQSNGKVFLINPNGVMFGAGSRVDVNGLVASSLAISNADFLAGRNNFTDVASAGKVSNAGTITTPAGGQIFLVAPAVENSGIISSANGDVVLAAGHSVQLFDSKDPNVQVVVSSPLDQAVNLGQIVAQGGRVGVYGALVSQRGAINANSAVRGENGRIVLKSSGTTMVEAGSTTTAVGSNLNTGGDIQLLGDKVGLTGNAVVDASGAAGGGTVLVGGDYQGKNAAVQNAQQTFVGKDAVIKADATGLGDGGKVIVWSDEATRVYGSISARGGANGGNGGFVETSGHRLDMQGVVDTRAPQGSTGKLLLDPSDVYIANSVSTATAAGMEGNNQVPSSGSTVFLETDYWVDSLLTTATLQNALATTDVTVSTINNITRGGVGFIKVLSPVNWSSSHSLTLEATTDINLKAAIDAPNAALNLHANGGLITQVTSPIDGLTASSINAIAASSISLDNTGNSVSGQIALQTTSGNATVTAQSLSLGAVNVGGALVASGVNSLTTHSAITAGGDITLTADQMTLGAAVNGSTGHTVTLQPYSNSTNVALGGSAADATGTLGLSQAELQNISVGGGKLAIGAFDGAHTGNVAVSGNLDLTSTLASGTLLLEAQSGSITIGQPLSLAGGLTLQTTNNISVPASVSVGGTFTLADGSWAQLGTLPAFSAHDFRIGGGTFLRASGGDGVQTPYLLEDVYGLQGAGSLLMLASYKLNTNIDASGTANWNSGQGFKPIGGLDYAYTGTFDGNSLAINGLHINRSGSNNVGLFSYLGTGTIKDLWLNSGVVTGQNNVGGVYGSSSPGAGGGHVLNVHAGVDVTGVFNVGGVAGTNYAAISDSSSSGTATGIAGADASNIGGLVGRNLGSIGYSSSSSNVNSTGFGYAGGLVGSNQSSGDSIGTIGHAFATGSVTATGEIIGGLVGDNNGGTVSVAYSTGDVNGGRNVGGFAGRNTNNGSITNVYTSSNVSGNALDSSYSHSNMGGLLGDLNSGTVSNSFSNGSVTGTAFSGAHVYGMVGSHESGNLVHGYFDATKAGTASDIAGTALTTAQSMTAASFAGFDISGLGRDQSSSVWRIYEGLDTPLLRDFLTQTSVTVNGSGSKIYDGNAVTPSTSSSMTGINGTLSYGTGGALNAGTYNATGLYSRTYDITYAGAGSQLIISPRAINATVSVSKVYNGNASFEGTPTVVFDDAISTDLGVGKLGVGLSATFVDKNVGSNKALTVNSVNLNGTAAGNYTLGTVTGSGTGNITPATLTVGGLSAASRQYDATTAAVVTGTAHVLGVDGDNVALAGSGSATFNNKNVGEGKNVLLNLSGYSLTGTDAGNYVLAAPTLTADITRAPLTVSGLTANNLVYNLNYDTGGHAYGTAATLSGGTLSGVLGSDVVNIAGSSSSFADRNVGIAKPVTVRSLTLGGTDGGNYQVTVLPTGLTANITPAPLTISGLTVASRPYDATSVATLSGGALNGVLSAAYGEGPIDSVTLVQGAAAFADKNVGVDKAVNLSGALSLSGASAGNYQLQLPTNVKGTITARALSTFNAASGGLWSDAGNWADGIAPDGANVLAAAIQSGSGTITYDASAGNTTLANFSVGSGRNLELTGGALTVTGTGGKSYASGATLTLNGGSLVLNGSLDGTYLTLTSGTISGTSSGANLYVNNLTQTGGSIDMSGSLNVINGNSIAIGSVRAQSGITLNAGEGGTITQTGPLVTDSLHAMATNGITLTNTGNHVGAFTATNYSGDIRLNNTVNSGELALGPLSTTGNIIIDNHGGIHTAGTIHAIHSGANTGLVSIAAHSPITVNDTIDGSDIGLSASTSITLAPGTSLQSTNTIGLTAGTGIAMDSSSVVNSGSSIALTAGTGIVLGGSLSVASGGSISATAASGSITASSGTSINSSGGTIILAAPQGSVTTPNVTFTGVQPTVTDGAAAAAAAAQAAAAAAAAQAAADAAAKAAADAAAKAAADAAAAAAAQAAADAAAKAAADAAAKAAADAAAKAAADAAAAQAAADAAKAAADAAAKAAADAAAKAAADAAAKAAADAAAKAAADAAAKAAADAAAQAAADAAAKAASDAAAKAAADAAAKAAADAAAAAAAAGSGTPTPVGQALNSTVNIINTVTTTVQANKNTPATVPAAPDTTVASTGSGSGGNSKPDEKVPDSKATDKKDDTGTTAVAKNEPTKKMYCN
ncbi:YDG domain-containing protein [Duganella sp. Dugasp56]|uniref:YDG domain-containing protein n=1 Tax=Duganella sp. Dugasp56 TaxID=3243046 RepID=UPI0039AE9F41